MNTNTRKPTWFQKQSAIDLAETAIDVLKVRGWCQGELHDKQGRSCLLGAINTAANWNGTETGKNLLIRTLGNLIKKEDAFGDDLGDQKNKIISFNDDKAEKKQQVIRKLQSTVNQLEKLETI